MQAMSLDQELLALCPSLYDPDDLDLPSAERVLVRVGRASSALLRRLNVSPEVAHRTAIELVLGEPGEA